MIWLLTTYPLCLLSAVHQAQPRSQGSLLPTLWSERERETLENAGHVGPEQNKF